MLTLTNAMHVKDLALLLRLWNNKEYLPLKDNLACSKHFSIFICGGGKRDQLPYVYFCAVESTDFVER